MRSHRSALRGASTVLAAALLLAAACTEDAGTAPPPCPSGFTAEDGRCVQEELLEITPSRLGPGVAGRAFFVQLVALGGEAPYTFTLQEGALPDGLTLSPSGALTGTPTTVQSVTFTLQALDAQGRRGQATWGVDILASEGCEPERCDGFDNDCDGATDERPEDTGGPCGPNDGSVCAQGTLTCQQGAPVCEGLVPLRDEVCDQQDNDCDGAVDEGGACDGPCASQPCTPGEAECVDANATRVCAVDEDGCGVWGPPSACATACADTGCEACADVDGDGRGRGCLAGGDCDEADPNIFRGATEACDGQDNDCDGASDEGNACTRECGPDACTPGATRCANNESAQTCARVDTCGVWGQATRCERGCADGACRGCTDNDNDGHGPGCEAGPDCNDASDLQYFGAPEACDGIDNDCDGLIDNNDACAPDLCQDDDLEDNDTAQQATDLPEGARTDARACGFSQSADPDWFDLGTFITGQQVQLELRFTAAACLLHLELFQNNTRVALSSATDNGADLDHRFLIPGNARVVVIPDLNAPEGCDYNLRHR